VPERSPGAGPFAPDLGQPQQRGPLAGDDDEIDARGHKIRPEPEALPANALDPIALDGAADLLRDDEPEARRRVRYSDRSRDEKDEVRARRPPYVRLLGRSGSPAGRRLDALEVRVPPDLSAARQLLLVGRDREALPPLAPTVGEDLLATARRHARAKAVRADAAEVVGLVRPFHDADPRRPRKGRGENHPAA